MSSRARNRASVLIVAMIFSAIIAVSLGSYIQVGQTNLRVANRAFYQNAALNLAESGLEYAMWSVNQQATGGGNAWTGWTLSGGNATRTFTNFTLDQNATGSVRVLVQNYTLASAPRLLARATITPQPGPPLEKWIEVRVTRRSLFANGLVARDTITFSGSNTMVDSYDSRLGDYNADLGGGNFNRYARGSAGSLSVTTGAFSLGNGDIYGYVSIGTSDYSGLSMGPNGRVGDFGAAVGSIDYSHVTTDFSADFDPPVTPTPPSVYNLGGIGSTALPRTGDTPAADGNYYYNVTGISLSGGPGNKLQIRNHPDTSDPSDVVIMVTGTAGNVVSVTGNASFQIDAGNTLNLYASGNISIAGRGVANANHPAAFMLWGTKTTADQSLSVSGNGQLNGVVYAPNADVSMNGGGSSGAVRGAIVANNITITGNSSFAYDEALADMNDSNPFGLVDWEEITTAADRASRLALVNF
jgi:hypothetical protein